MSESTDAPEQIIINGQEYSPEDAQSLIELGNKWRETESSLNTSLDKVVPEYTKATQDRSRLEKEIADRDAKIAEFTRQQEEKAAKANTPEDAEAIRANARKYGLLDEETVKERGYLTKNEVEEMLSQREVNQRLVDTVNKEADQLTKEIDGTDGRPKFNSKAVLAYAGTYNFKTLREAYEDMNSDQLAPWKERQLAEARKPGLTTLKASGVKTPEKTKITGDNFKDALNEALFGVRE